MWWHTHCRGHHSVVKSAEKDPTDPERPRSPQQAEVTPASSCRSLRYMRTSPVIEWVHCLDVQALDGPWSCWCWPAGGSAHSSPRIVGMQRVGFMVTCCYTRGTWRGTARGPGRSAATGGRLVLAAAAMPAGTSATPACSPSRSAGLPSCWRGGGVKPEGFSRTAANQ